MNNVNEYNGWTNYATWRVNLEMFDGMTALDFGIQHETPYDAGQSLKEYAEETIEQSSSEGWARDYAMAFLSDVNWREIALHKLAEYADEDADEYADEDADEYADEDAA